MPEPVTVRVPAKINLCLRVGAVRPDGFHELTTVFQAVSLHDDLTAAAADGLRAEVTGEGAELVPAGAENLAVRAAALLAGRAGYPGGAHLRIRKGIPVAGGMAGGSADAAAALVACDVLWDTGYDRAALLELARELGSDVPFALHGGTALGTGRGDQLTEVLARGSYHWVLALAAGGLSTPQVYAAHDRLRTPPGPPPDAVLAALRAGDAASLGRALANDLQPAALSLRPTLARVLAAGRDLGALGAVVSGSGPTVAMLARDGSAAVALAAALAGTGLCQAVRRATGPVAGARVLDTGGGDRPG